LQKRAAGTGDGEVEWTWATPGAWGLAVQHGKRSLLSLGHEGEGFGRVFGKNLVRGDLKFMSRALPVFSETR
jgi:hypothetical protein